MMENKTRRAQSAIEYLTTYGWAILIIAIVIIALFRLGVFNPTGVVSTTCVFPAEFGCLSATLYANSTLLVNLQQSLQHPINITAWGCNNQALTTNMFAPVNAITLGIGDNTTLNMSCYQNGTVASLRPGELYSGFVIVNYTDLVSGFHHVAVGSLKAKVV